MRWERKQISWCAIRVRELVARAKCRVPTYGLRLRAHRALFTHRRSGRLAIASLMRFVQLLIDESLIWCRGKLSYSD